MLLWVFLMQVMKGLVHHVYCGVIGHAKGVWSTMSITV